MSKFSEKDIEAVIKKLKRRHPEYATREMAIKYLENTKSFTKLLVSEAKKIKSNKIN